MTVMIILLQRLIIIANRSDIIIKTRKIKIFLLIDVAISSDRDEIQKETENKLKYILVFWL
jgi:hypothetical protein